LADRPCEQPLRKLGDVWRRQVRWARLRRITFSTYYFLEVFSGTVAPVLASVATVQILDWPVALILLIWYVAEAALMCATRWHFLAMSLLACIGRDLAQPTIWIAGLVGTGFVWRGNVMTLA
jgi:ceramide glucosyltransferase